MVEPSTIDAAMCERLINSAHKACTPPVALAAPSTPPVGQPPEWDALANAFASLSMALAWGSLLLGIVAIVAGVAWARHVRKSAEEEARAEARKCVEELMREWRSTDLPPLVRQSVEVILDASKGLGNDLTAADEMGEGAGE